MHQAEELKDQRDIVNEEPKTSEELVALACEIEERLGGEMLDF